MDKLHEKIPDDFISPSMMSKHEIQNLIDVMADDTIFKSVKTIIDTMLIEESRVIIRMLRADKPDAECVSLIRYGKGKIEVLSNLLGYLVRWRNTALKQRKEESDGKKEKSKKRK